MTHESLTKQFELSVYKPDRLIKLSLKLDLVSNLSSHDLIIPKEAFHPKAFSSHAPRPIDTRTPLYSNPDTRTGVTPGPIPCSLDHQHQCH